MSFLSKCKTSAQKAFELIPRPDFSSGVLLAAGAATGAAAGFAPPSWWFAGALFALLLWLKDGRSRTFFLAGTIVAFASALWQNIPASDSYLRKVPDRSCRVFMALEITDSRLCRAPGIDPPKLLRSRVREMNGAPASGKVLFFPPPGMIPLRCGDRVEVSGTLEAFRPEYFRPDGSGVFSRFRVDEKERILRGMLARKTGEYSGVFPPLMRLRDRLVARLCAGIDSDSTRNLAAAFLFGATGGMDFRRKADFVASGTIHLFSISGMHVGFLAAVVLYLLRGVPFRSRYWILTGVLLIYVLMTGAEIPALRAFGMIALYAILRTFLRYTPPFRALALACAVILMVNPAAAGSVGFLFSFVITGALLLTAERLRDFREIFQEHLQLMPPSPEAVRARRRCRFAFFLAGIAAVCLSAFLAGAGILLLFQHRILPGSLIANLLLPLLMPLILVLAPLKLTLGAFWAEADHWLGLGIECFFHLLRLTAGIGTDLFNAVAVPPPPVWLVPLFYAALFSFFVSRRRKTALFCGGAALALLFLPALKKDLSPPTLTVISGDARIPPCIVIAEPANDRSVVVNPTGEGVLAATDGLLESGFLRAGEVLFSAPRQVNCGGFPQLERLCGSALVRIVPPDAGAWKFLETLETRAERRDALPSGRLEEICRIFPQKDGFLLEYRNPGSMLSFELISKNTDAGRRITLRRKESLLGEELLAWGNIPGEWKYEFR